MLNITFPSKDDFIKYFNSLISWIEVNDVTFTVITITIIFAIFLLTSCMCVIFWSCCSDTYIKTTKYLKSRRDAKKFSGLDGYKKIKKSVSIEFENTEVNKKTEEVEVEYTQPKRE